jgi:hypothetical protein
MRLADRTRTVLDIPLSPAEFWLGVAIGALMLATILFALRPFLRTVMNIGGWS